MKLRILAPWGFFFYALGYAAFALTMRTPAMIGDTRGYDPGSRLVPFLAAAVLGVLALAQALKEMRAEKNNAAGADEYIPAGLLAANIVIAALFIGLFRHAGAVLAIWFALFFLITLNFREAGEGASWTRVAAWLAAGTGYVLAAYTVLRCAVKLCFHAARAYGLAAGREPAVQAVAAALAVAALVFFAGRAMRAAGCGRNMIRTLQIGAGVTMAVYIVFRQLFLVQLPAGMLAGWFV